MRVYHKNYDNYVMNKAMLQGFERTRKSFALDSQIIFVKLISCDIYSTLTVAPTGAAAANYGGDTSD